MITCFIVCDDGAAAAEKQLGSVKTWEIIYFGCFRDIDAKVDGDKGNQCTDTQHTDWFAKWYRKERLGDKTDYRKV